MRWLLDSCFRGLGRDGLLFRLPTKPYCRSRGQEARGLLRITALTQRGCKRTYTLGQRARTLDRTVYVGPRARAGSAAFVAQYGERLSAAAVIGDASRCLRRLPALRQQAALAAQRAAQRRANAPAAP